MHFFGYFTVKKTSRLLPAEWLSCLNIKWFADIDAIYRGVVFTPEFLICRGEIKGTETFFRLILIPNENKTPALN